MSIDLDMAEIAELFIEESMEGLDIMESGLLNLDLGAADAAKALLEAVAYHRPELFVHWQFGVGFTAG